MIHDSSTFKRVPVTKFRREMRKWLRLVDKTGEPIIITQRNGPELVLVKFVDYNLESI
jgi:prevent-host-death family protein